MLVTVRSSFTALLMVVAFLAPLLMPATPAAALHSTCTVKEVDTATFRYSGSERGRCVVLYTTGQVIVGPGLNFQALHPGALTLGSGDHVLVVNLWTPPRKFPR